MDSSQGSSGHSQEAVREAVQAGMSAATGLPRVFAGGRLSPLLRYGASQETEGTEIDQSCSTKFRAKYPDLAVPVKFTTSQLHYLQNKAYSLSENPVGDGRSRAQGIKAVNTPLLRIVVEGSPGELNLLHCSVLYFVLTGSGKTFFMTRLQEAGRQLGWPVFAHLEKIETDWRINGVSVLEGGAEGGASSPAYIAQKRIAVSNFKRLFDPPCYSDTAIHIFVCIHKL